MDSKVTEYIKKINQDWQTQVCNQLRTVIHATVPQAEELLQWQKPHYKINGKYLCNFATAKDWVNFTLFNGSSIKLANDLFEPGENPERKSIKVRKGQEIDYKIIAKLIKQAAV